MSPPPARQDYPAEYTRRLLFCGLLCAVHRCELDLIAVGLYESANDSIANLDDAELAVDLHRVRVNDNDIAGMYVCPFEGVSDGFQRKHPFLRQQFSKTEL